MVLAMQGRFLRHSWTRRTVRLCCVVRGVLGALLLCRRGEVGSMIGRELKRGNLLRKRKRRLLIRWVREVSGVSVQLALSRAYSQHNSHSFTDTFIAGMLFALHNHNEWLLDGKLRFANELAGRKVLQEGFADLARKMQSQDTST